MTHPAPLMNAREVAEYLQLSVDTVSAYARKGELPAMKVGGRWRFKRAQVERWLRARARAAAREERAQEAADSQAAARRRRQMEIF